MSFSAKHVDTHLHLARLLYLCMVVLSFYWLFVSRSGEVHTVWEYMNPAFMPSFFFATLLLLMLVFSSERLGWKLFFVIIHSILCVSLSVIIFPFGIVGTTQIVLGRSRRVFDNIVLHGPWGWQSGNILLQLYLWMRGTVLQTAFNTILARMLGVDIFWTNLLFLPLLWGIFIPVMAFKISETVGLSKKFSVLSGLLVFLFPSFIGWGSSSVPNSFGFLFFFCSMYFFLRYLSRPEGYRTIFLMMVFSLAAFLSHFLPGLMAFSFLLLAVAFRKYENTRNKSFKTAKILLSVSAIFCAIILPLGLVFQGVFYAAYAYFSLDKLSGLSFADITWLLLLGKYLEYDAKTLLTLGIGPLLGLVGMIYNLSTESDKERHLLKLFLFVGFLILLVDYRLLKLFMANVPFSEERIWLLRDMLAVPFVAMVVGGTVTFLGKMTSRYESVKAKFSFSSPIKNLSLRTIIAPIVISILLSAWITNSVYNAYPRASALQTTWYEMEAVRYIDETTNRSYVVIGDQWIIYAGEIIVGINNPRAYYFYHTNPQGNALFRGMLNNPSSDLMIEAMSINNSTIAFFVVEQPRLDEKEFESAVAQASINPRIRLYGVFGNGKLYVFYYEKT